MSILSKPPAVSAIESAALPLTGAANDYDALLALIGDARFVLIGEASHGSHEFYRERARITRRLIEELHFDAVAVEADWPDAHRVNRYVRGIDEYASGDAALSGFRRFPTWMWRNTEVLAFVEWLRAYNDTRAVAAQGAGKAGFYGLDLYSLFSSIREVLQYLEKIDPEAAKRARARYGCFDHFHEDSQRYGYAAGFGLSKPCEDGVVAQLRDLHAQATQYADTDSQLGADAYFHAEQNARLIIHAEEYYRTMFHDRVQSWNLRDRHMAGTLDALAAHLSRPGRPARIVVWAHNSHLGDARATEMGWNGELNLGQLAREAYGDQTVLIGLTTHHGSVTAASEWDGPAERKRIRPALAGSVERAFHLTGLSAFMLSLRGDTPAVKALDADMLERAIGVIYLPETERQSHYFDARVSRQFDAILHFDETRAIVPLETSVQWTASGEAPETYPAGL